MDTFYRRVIRETVVPLVLIVATVNCAVAIPYFVVQKHGHAFLTLILRQGLVHFIKSAWRAVDWRDWEAWTAIGVLALWANLSLLLPGKEYHGPPTSSGFRPTYYRSGFYFYLITMIVVVPLIWHYPMLRWYYKLVTMGGILSVCGVLVCVALFIKGHLAPSPGLFGSSGNPLFDFYWGLELYPRYGFDNLFDLKTIVNSRFGLFLWQLVVLVCWKANYELHTAAYRRGDVSWAISATTVLQTIYLAKFYLWEDGYMSTIDISVDKFGFMIGWGCIAWVPTFYPLTSVYLVKHSPRGFGLFAFVAVVTLGLAMIAFNYWADKQRQGFREAQGKCNIWGQPAKAIHAVYEGENGERKRNALLASGFWGIARHLNYAFELGAALAWSSCGGATSLVPYLYFMFLFVLLVHRSLRDDEKCRAKYGKYWEIYCQEVRFQILPYVF